MKHQLITLLATLFLSLYEADASQEGKTETQGYDEHHDKMIEFTPDDGKRRARLHIVRDEDGKDWQKKEWLMEKEFAIKCAKRAKKIVANFWQPPRPGESVALLIDLPKSKQQVATNRSPALTNQEEFLPVKKYLPQKMWSKNLLARLRLKTQLTLGHKRGLAQMPVGRQAKLQQVAGQSRSTRAHADYQSHQVHARSIASINKVHGRGPAMQQESSHGLTLAPWGNKKGFIHSIWEKVAGWWKNPVNIKK